MNWDLKKFFLVACTTVSMFTSIKVSQAEVVRTPSKIVVGWAGGYWAACLANDGMVKVAAAATVTQFPEVRAESRVAGRIARAVRDLRSGVTTKLLDQVQAEGRVCTGPIIKKRVNVRGSLPENNGIAGRFGLVKRCLNGSSLAPDHEITNVFEVHAFRVDGIHAANLFYHQDIVGGAFYIRIPVKADDIDHMTSTLRVRAYNLLTNWILSQFGPAGLPLRSEITSEQEEDVLERFACQKVFDDELPVCHVGAHALIDNRSADVYAKGKKCVTPTPTPTQGSTRTPTATPTASPTETPETSPEPTIKPEITATPDAVKTVVK